MVHSDSDLILHNSSVLIDKEPKNLSQNEVHSDPDLILYNPSVLIDKEPNFVAAPFKFILSFGRTCGRSVKFLVRLRFIKINS